MDDKADLDRIKDKAQDVRDDVSALAAESVEAMRKAIDDLAALANANASGARDLGYAKLQDFSAAVRRNPLTSVALGVGAGLIIGLWRQRDVR